MTAVIIGSGSISNYAHIYGFIHSGDLVICCDGGANHAKQMSIKPDVIVGDLDSIDKDVLKHYESQGIEFERFDTAKDFSDMEIGLNKAILLGADKIVLIGATGDRLDHTASNIQLLYNCLNRKIDACIIDDNNKISLINKKTVLTEKIGQTVSLLPFTEEVTGITTCGLQYPLNNESLRCGETRGISNVCVSEKASVDFKTGILMLIVPIRS